MIGPSSFLSGLNHLAACSDPAPTPSLAFPCIPRAGHPAKYSLTLSPGFVRHGRILHFVQFLVGYSHS